MSKILYVSSTVQSVLMSEVFIPELIDGFWKNHRPAGHGDVWRDVSVAVSTDGVLGPVGFDAPRNYNFLNLDFALPNEARLVAVARTAKANSNFKSVKKELIELGRIVGSRLASRDATALKLFRGNHKDGTITVSSARARHAVCSLTGSALEVVRSSTVAPEQAPTRQLTKRTVVKLSGTQLLQAISAKSTPQAEMVITTTSTGATVRRVPLAIDKH